MKKHIIFIALVLASWTLSAQVAIEKTSVDGSSLLDFKANTTKGIILPATAALPANINGTLVFNKADSRVYMRQNDIWVPLTAGTGNSSAIIANTSTEVGTGVIIGATSSPVAGVLVLESSTLALTLPKIDKPEVNVKGPYPGMICYDTASNTIAVFDGAFWNYWK